MAIIVNLDVQLAKRKMKLNELSELVDISVQNLSVLKTGKARAIRFSTLDKLCQALECTPGDLLEYQTRGYSLRMIRDGGTDSVLLRLSISRGTDAARTRDTAGGLRDR